MDKREMLDRLAANGDERLLLGRVWDKYEQCRRRNLPQGTGFLSPAEQAAAQRLLNALSVSEGYTFWGGYDGAQRRQLWFLPDWQEAPEEDAVRVVRASFYEEDSLTHRDILGSLMALGVTRETLGDILVSPRWADVLATGPAAELLLSGAAAHRVPASGGPDPTGGKGEAHPGHGVLPAAGQRAGIGLFPQPGQGRRGRDLRKGPGELDRLPEAGSPGIPGGYPDPPGSGQVRSGGGRQSNEKRQGVHHPEALSVRGNR